MQSPTLSRRNFLRGAVFAALAGGTGMACAPLFSAPACAATEYDTLTAPLTETQILLGTFVSISIAQSSRQQAQDALALAFAEVQRLQGVFSRYDNASPLSVLNAQGRLADVPPELKRLLEQARSFTRLSDKAFDPSVMPVVDLFKAHQNPQGAMHIPDADLRAAQALVGFEHVRMDGQSVTFDRSHMGLTLDGIAKGHIVDAVSALLHNLGLHNHLINAGGDIVACGEKMQGTAWMAAVENPLYKKQRGSSYPETLTLRDAALATSGSYEIYYDASREHHHLINPASGSSPAAVLSVSVLAPTATEADALATALSVLPPQAAVALVDALPQRECCILGRHKLRMTSRGWDKA